MDGKMEDIIQKDLGISVEGIRNSSWESLENRKRKTREKAFRPKHMFPVGGNINLSMRREMGMFRININELKRRVIYKTRCLLMNKKRV